MQLNKNIKIFINYFLGPVLFVWLAFSIYSQIKAQPHLQASWQHIKNSFFTVKVSALGLVVLLMFINWGIEAVKWKLAVRGVYTLKFWQAYKAVLTGVSFSVTTPNRVGEYVGRVMYLPYGNRLKTVSVTLVTSLSQLVVTVATGTAAFVVLKKYLQAAGIINPTSFTIILSVLLVLLLTLLLLYLRISGIVKIFGRWFKKSRHLYLVSALQQFSVQLLVKLLALSVVRYGVFILQYFLLYRFFNVSITIVAVWSVVSLMFLVIAVVPTIALAEVGLRGQLSLTLMSAFTANSLGVGLTTISVWLINLIVPAVIGGLFLLSIKVFNRRNETV